MLRPTLLLVAVLAAAVAAEGQAPAAPTGPIAVLNLEAVLNNAKLFTTRMDALKAEGNQAELQLKDMDKQEQAIKGKLDLLSRNNPEHAQLQDQLELLRFRKKQFYDRTRGQLEKAQAELLVSSYEKVRGQLKAFADEHGYKLVLLAPSSRIGGNNVQEVLLQLGQQSVLTYDASLDITAAFVAVLNARFAADGADAKPDAKPAEGATGAKTETK